MKMKGVTKKIFVFSLVLFMILPLVNAGVGIRWDKESSLVPENTKTCLTYNVYNPWPEDSYVEIRLSEELMEIVSKMSSEVEFVPSGTSSLDAIPVNFCFKTPKVYERDCLLFNSLICKQECQEETKTYSGEVEVLEVGSLEGAGGAGGSATAMSVSAPLRVRVQCVEHKRNYSVVYITVALIAAILLAVNLSRKKKFLSKKKK